MRSSNFARGQEEDEEIVKDVYDEQYHKIQQQKLEMEKFKSQELYNEKVFVNFPILMQNSVSPRQNQIVVSNLMQNCPKTTLNLRHYRFICFVE